MKTNNPFSTLIPSQMGARYFVEMFGGVYEHSPWIAQQTWQQGLQPQHNSAAGLSELMRSVVSQAQYEQLHALLCAHPDLVGKAAIRGELTEDSTSEQASAGLDACSLEEFQQFQQLNQTYREKFGFPFIMAVKGSNRQQILNAFRERLHNTPDTEFQTAIQEVHKIAQLRIAAILTEP